MLKWVDELQAHLQAKAWSPVTIEGLAKNLAYFCRWLGKDDPRGVTPKTLKEYLGYLAGEYRTKAGKPLSYGTVNGRLFALRVYFGFLAKQRILLYDPSSALPDRPKINRLPDYIASEREMRQLLESPCPEEHHGIRDRAVLELAYSAGLRRNELVLLELADIDLTEQLVKVRHGKGGKQRVVPFGRKSREALERYLKITRSHWQKGSDLECPRFFLTERGRGLSITMVEEIVSKHRPDKRIHPHGLRHACALHMLKAGADIRYIQEMLGHASPNTTMIYTRVFPEDLRAIHDRYHPREKMRELAEA